VPVTRNTIYRGRIVAFGVESVIQPDGRRVDIEVARHPGGAAVVAVDGHGRVCLLRQFRGPFEEWLWELPAGKIDHGEPALITAQRELEEEAGLKAQHWHSLGTIFTCPGFSDEVIHLFLATRLVQGAVNTEAEEYIETHWLPLEEAMRRADGGEIMDAKTLVALYRASRTLSSETRAPGA
jgi:ADP-ribose pyrophosphatase